MFITYLHTKFHIPASVCGHCSGNFIVYLWQHEEHHHQAHMKTAF